MDLPNGYSQEDHEDARVIAKNLAKKNPNQKETLSARSLAMLQRLGKERYVEIVLFHADQINRSSAANSPGPGFLHSKEAGIDTGIQNIARAAHDRFVREARYKFYEFILRHIPADEIVRGCLFAKEDQMIAENADLIEPVKTDRKKVRRTVRRIKDRTIPLERAFTGHSESDDELIIPDLIQDRNALRDSDQEAEEDLQDDEGDGQEPELPVVRVRDRPVVAPVVAPPFVPIRPVFINLVSDEEADDNEVLIIASPKAKKSKLKRLIKRVEPVDEDDDLGLEDMKVFDEEEKHGQKRKRISPSQPVKSPSVMYTQSSEESLCIL